MLEIYFVRHGETEWNLKGMLQGKQNSPLTEKGRAQAAKLGEALKDVEFDGIYSSPMGRASLTAEIIRGEREQALFTIPALREMSFGDMEGLSKKEFQKLHPEQYKNLWEDALTYDPAAFNGETFQEVDDRVMEGLDHLVKAHPDGGRILVVSHGMTLKSIFMHVWGHGLDKYWEDPVPENTSLTIVSYKDGEYRMEDFSNTSHLD